MQIYDFFLIVQKTMAVFILELECRDAWYASVTDDDFVFKNVAIIFNYLTMSLSQVFSVFRK